MLKQITTLFFLNLCFLCVSQSKYLDYINCFYISYSSDVDFAYDSSEVQLDNFDENPISGRTIGFYENFRIQCEFNKGIPNGLFIAQYTEGNKDGWISVTRNAEKGLYQNGLKKGIWKQWYFNGKKKNKMKFDRNLKTGMQLVWHHNGQLISKEKYKNGLQNGKSKLYFKNGKVQRTCSYSHGKLNGISKEFYRNKKLKTIELFDNGKRIGDSKSYYPNGQIKSQTKRTNSGLIVEQKCFDSTGMVVPCIKKYKRSETNYDELSHLNRDTLILKSTGKAITGIIYDLHKNGNLAWQFNYVNGIENGIANVWYDNGKIYIIEKWNNGVKINFEKSFTNGQIAQIQNFNASTGLFEGIEQSWFENGQIKSDLLYESDKIIGFEEGWYINGQQKYSVNHEEITDANFNSVKKETVTMWFYDGKLKSKCTFEGEKLIKCD